MHMVLAVPAVIKQRELIQGPGLTVKKQTWAQMNRIQESNHKKVNSEGKT